MSDKPVFSTRPSTAAALRAAGAAAGRVAARFERSFNAQVVASGTGTGAGAKEERLLNFHIEADAVHPLGFCVGADVLEAAAEGATVEIDWPHVRVGAIRATAAARLEEPELPIAPSDVLNAHGLRENARRLDREIRLFGRRSAVGAAVLADEGEFADPVGRLRRALRRACASRTTPAAVDLGAFSPWLGGGEGATPAFDDLLTGVLLADRVAGGLRVAASRAFLEAARRRTTAPSYWQIRLADAGRSSLLVERAVHRLLTGAARPADIVPCLALGHTSGTDILGGVLLYLGAGPRPSRRAARIVS